MKKIMIIDGGPRKNMNTAAMIEAFANGAKSVSDEIEVKNYNRYDMQGFNLAAKQQWHEEYWQKELQNAFDAGKRMAEKL